MHILDVVRLDTSAPWDPLNRVHSLGKQVHVVLLKPNNLAKVIALNVPRQDDCLFC